MIEILRWIGLVISGFSICVSSYSLWLSLCQNKKLIREKRALLIENARLRSCIAIKLDEFRGEFSDEWDIND